MPTDDEIALFNPASAMLERVSGSVLLQCKVTLKHRARDCQVLREEPKGYGFGRAALAASRIFHIQPVRVDGVAIDDGPVIIPLTFTNR